MATIEPLEHDWTLVICLKEPQFIQQQRFGWVTHITDQTLTLSRVSTTYKGCLIQHLYQLTLNERDFDWKCRKCYQFENKLHLVLRQNKQLYFCSFELNSTIQTKQFVLIPTESCNGNYCSIWRKSQMLLLIDNLFYLYEHKTDTIHTKEIMTLPQNDEIHNPIILECLENCFIICAGRNLLSSFYLLNIESKEFDPLNVKFNSKYTIMSTFKDPVINAIGEQEFYWISNGIDCILKCKIDMKTKTIESKIYSTKTTHCECVYGAVNQTFVGLSEINGINVNVLIKPHARLIDLSVISKFKNTDDINESENKDDINESENKDNIHWDQSHLYKCLMNEQLRSTDLENIRKHLMSQNDKTYESYLYSDVNNIVNEFIDLNGLDCKNPTVINGKNKMKWNEVLCKKRICECSIQCLVGQYGLTAKEPIEKDTVLGQFIGFERSPYEIKPIQQTIEYQNYQIDKYAFECVFNHNWKDNMERYIDSIDKHFQYVNHEGREYICVDPISAGFNEIPQYAYTSWINDCRGNIQDSTRNEEDLERENVYFDSGAYCGWPVIFAITLRNVQKGEQLIGFYGSDYGAES